MINNQTHQLHLWKTLKSHQRHLFTGVGKCLLDIIYIISPIVGWCETLRHQSEPLIQTSEFPLSLSHFDLSHGAPGLCATDLARYVVSGKDEPLEADRCGRRGSLCFVTFGQKYGRNDHKFWWFFWVSPLASSKTRPNYRIVQAMVTWSRGIYGKLRSKWVMLHTILHMIWEFSSKIEDLIGIFDGIPRSNSNLWDIVWNIKVQT